MSDDESIHSSQSEDLFLNDEDSCDVADMVQAGTDQFLLIYTYKIAFIIIIRAGRRSYSVT